MKKVSFMDLGRMHYGSAWRIQEAIVQSIKEDKKTAGCFLMVEHHPVLTIGKEGGFENLLYAKEELRKKGLEIYEVNRGGNITYHGPGQIVGYPILDLSRFKKDVRWYVNRIEEMMIRTLKHLGINGGRKEKYRGVWVMNHKIGAIGIGVKSWITMHGFALNYDTDLDFYKMINPCGITDFGVTSITSINKEIEKEVVVDAIKYSFKEIFECDLVHDDRREATY